PGGLGSPIAGSGCRPAADDAGSHWVPGRPGRPGGHHVGGGRFAIRPTGHGGAPVALAAHAAHRQSYRVMADRPGDRACLGDPGAGLLEPAKLAYLVLGVLQFVAIARYPHTIDWAGRPRGSTS